MTIQKYDYVNGTDIKNLTQGVAVTLDEVKAEIDRIMDVFDVEFCPAEDLPIIGALFGFEIDTTEDPEYQRKLLKTAIDVIKNKGTFDSFKIIFKNLGFDITIKPQWTADYYEEVTVNLPYIQLDNLPAMDVGFYDIVVINPDDQYDEVKNLLEYVF